MIVNYHDQRGLPYPQSLEVLNSSLNIHQIIEDLGSTLVYCSIDC